MISESLLITFQSRQFSAHHLLIHAARRSYERAQKKEPGYDYEILTSMMFSALGIEALSNAVGERIVPDWNDFESARPLAKLRLLCSHLGIEFDRTKRPWSKVKDVVAFRNLVAHAKPQLVEETHRLTEREHASRQFLIPASRLEKMLTLGNAALYLETVIAIKDLLIERIPPEQALGLAVDSWSGKTSLLRTS